MIRDPFQAARIAHQQAQAGAVGQVAPSQPHAPGAPGSAPAPVAPMAPGQAPSFLPLARKFGVDKLKLDANPIVARTQVMNHLKQSLGPQFMAFPGVSDLMQSLGQHLSQKQEQAVHAKTGQEKQNVKALMG